MAWPVDGGSKLSIGSGERGRVVSGEEGVVQGGGVSGVWGQMVRARGCFSSVKGMVRGVVRSVGSVWGR